MIKKIEISKSEEEYTKKISFFHNTNLIISSSINLYDNNINLAINNEKYILTEKMLKRIKIENDKEEFLENLIRKIIEFYPKNLIQITSTDEEFIENEIINIEFFK